MLVGDAAVKFVEAGSAALVVDVSFCLNCMPFLYQLQHRSPLGLTRAGPMPQYYLGNSRIAWKKSPSVVLRVRFTYFPRPVYAALFDFPTRRKKSGTWRGHWRTIELSFS